MDLVRCGRIESGTVDCPVAVSGGTALGDWMWIVET